MDRPASINEPRKSSNRLIAEIAADESGPAWIGDFVEKIWAGQWRTLWLRRLGLRTVPGLNPLKTGYLSMTTGSRRAESR